MCKNHLRPSVSNHENRWMFWLSVISDNGIIFRIHKTIINRDNRNLFLWMIYFHMPHCFCLSPNRMLAPSSKWKMRNKMLFVFLHKWCAHGRHCCWRTGRLIINFLQMPGVLYGTYPMQGPGKPWFSTSRGILYTPPRLSIGKLAPLRHM